MKTLERVSKNYYYIIRGRNAEKLQMLLQSCMRLKIYLLWMLEDTVLSSYSIIDHRKVLKMQLLLWIAGACLKTCGRNGLIQNFTLWQREHHRRVTWFMMKCSNLCQRKSRRSLLTKNQILQKWQEQFSKKTSVRAVMSREICSCPFYCC